MGRNKASGNKKVSSIEEQMAHLKWRKMCTESRMQGMLTSTKKLSQRDTVLRLGNNRAEYKAYRAQQIIQDELKKPLEVSNDFLQEFEKKIESERSRDEATSRQHVKSVKRLEQKVQERAQQQSRNKVFQEQKRLLYSSSSTK